MTESNLGVVNLFNSDAGISEEEINIASPILLKMIKHYQHLSNDSLKKVKDILDEELPLNKIVKSIYQYTEFELLEWHFHSNLDNHQLKYRPKGVAVSFWGIGLDNVILH